MATLHRVDGSVEIPAELPVIALRDLVYFPYMVLPLLIGRPRSVAALKEAEDGGKLALVVAQKDPEVADPGEDDIHLAGTIVRVLQASRLADGTVRAVFEGIGRARAEEFVPADDGMRAQVSLASEWERDRSEGAELTADAAGAKEVKKLFSEYVRLAEQIPPEVAGIAEEVADCVQLGHVIAGHLLVGSAERQEVLEADALTRRFDLLREILVREVELLRIQEKVSSRFGLRPGKDEEFLLEEIGGARTAEWRELAQAVAEAGLPDHAKERAERELDRLAKLNAMAPEASVARTYLEWICGLPWTSETTDNQDIGRAAAVLDAEHYGLREVKERVLDHIAVLSLAKALPGPILFLVGPPGVGKTSLGRSIANCLERKFVRASLGGVRDEAEIRGHRRTYVGALPGRVVQGMRKAGSRNPVFLLDEVDKLARDFHGDPAAALLEVLDPEQNRAFADHYLELEFDLSQVLFIATANTLGEVPGPLRDRMEVIRLPGYLDTEKKAIARQFLWPKLVARHGLEPYGPLIDDEAVGGIIASYTREAGVRELEQRLSRVARKLARRVLSARGGEAGGDGAAGVDGEAGEATDGKPATDAAAKHSAAADGEPVATSASAGGRRTDGAAKPATDAAPPRVDVDVDVADLPQLLGPPVYVPAQAGAGSDRRGIARGLAWTASGGEVIDVEVAVVPGSGKIRLTGTLGDIMKESAFAAVTYARSRARGLGLSERFHRDMDLHIHIPEGATPKDGPSAGITIAVALVSALTLTPTRTGVAMTGEITLRGRVLVVGGIREKAVAALRAGVKRVLVPAANAKDSERLPPEVLRNLELVPVDTMEQVLQEALDRPVAGARARSAPAHAAGLAPSVS